MTCPPIIHHIATQAWHPIRRRIWHVAAIAVASGCAGTAVAIVPRLADLLAPPTVERAVETPTNVPEPGALWVLASGVAGVIAVRITQKLKENHMKTLAAALIAATIITAPALADTPSNVTLVIENDAGMVTQVSDLTGRECDAIAALLAARKVPNMASGFYITGSMILSSTPKQATSKLTTAKCVTSTEK